ncbi:MAG: hypothetical protein D6780_01380 [Candidatus Dadabacteria bacterium]|nr:MAG: hypothetical protein D6780_01380 [Candidatus Dadabacteria bacterium]
MEGSTKINQMTEEAKQLVIEHQDWAAKIARAVARGWGLDWQLDGLDGAAYEALIGAAQRFDPSRNVAFKSYARRRIYEAACEAARQAKSWSKKGGEARVERLAKNISFELLEIFPELKKGQISTVEGEEGQGGINHLIKQMLIAASLIAGKHGHSDASPEELLDYKKLLKVLAKLHLIHQVIVWRVYWEGDSLRGIAADWNIDELNVIREHKNILSYLEKFMTRTREPRALEVRPSLKEIVLKLQQDGIKPPFVLFLQGEDPYGR